MNTNIMNTQTFHINKYEVIEGHKRSLKVTKGHLSFREFDKILPNTFIYESILIKIYMNTNIMNTQILKVTFMFILTLTYVLMDNFLS